MLWESLAIIRKSPSKILTIVLTILIACLALIGIVFDSTPSITDTVDKHARIEGVVSQEVDVRSNGQRVVLNEVVVERDSVEGKLLIRLPLYPEVQYGDKLIFGCELKSPEPFEGFEYDTYLAIRGIYAICHWPRFLDIESGETTVVGSVLSFKKTITDTFGKMFPEPHAAFLSGLLFGGSSSLSFDLREDFTSTGTTHILAASGFNVSLFTLVFLSVASGWLGKKRAIVVAGVLLLMFVIMAGATPSVLRAAIMAFLILIAGWVGRKAQMLNLLLIASAGLLLINPQVILDAGFQLSVVATGALLLLASKWEPSFSFVPSAYGIRTSFVASLAASAATLPILLWHFGSISLISPIANLLILPLIPYLMAAAFLALPVYLGLQAVGIPSFFIILPAWALSSLVLHLIIWLSSVPFAIVSPNFAKLLSIILLGIYLIIWIVHTRRQNAMRLRQRS